MKSIRRKNVEPETYVSMAWFNEQICMFCAEVAENMESELKLSQTEYMR